MISRFGQPIYVGWPEHHLIMIEAALTLDWRERQQAFKDIAEITTRSIKQVRARAKAVKARAREVAPRGAIMHLPANWLLPPSQLRQPTRQQLMGCR